MYDLYEKLTLGWYYGNDEVNLREYVALLIQKVAKYLSIDNSNIIIIGSSGGGAATFEVGYYLPKCTTISINAQIKLMDYGIYGKELEDVVGIKIGEDVFHRDDALWYINNSRCRNLIIMNMRSEVDIKQLQRIKDSLGVRLYYGMNIINDDTLIWLYDAYASPYVSPHNTQDNKCIFFVLDYMIQNNFDIPYLKDLVIIVNEFWRKGWQQELKYRSEKISLYQLKKIQNMNRNIALFGTGDIANGLNDKYFDIQNENYYNISIAFDNDTKKIGGLYKGIKILNPNTYQSWNNCFVIIAVKNKIEEIIKQLETYGLIRGQNFITYHELYE